MDRYERYIRNLLRRGVYSRKDLWKRLRGRDCDVDYADELLDRYEEMGMVDDRAYAVLFVDGHPDWSVRRLRDELRARGVCSSFVAEALDGADIDEDDRAMRLARGWLSSGIDPGRIEGRLSRRGFSRGTIYRVLENYDTLRD